MILEYDTDADGLFALLRIIEPGTLGAVTPLDDRRNVHLDAEAHVFGVEFLRVSEGIDLTDVPYAREIAAALRAVNAITTPPA